ncbi:TPA: hypothetical protein DEW47_02805 [Patescibacteria group bacterium]|nr:MAG: Chromosome partition protein Smc [Parcubacteria group bacterium GW2011_GWF2_40_10]KKR46630.1 MAG: Chromosome partition protein Smc [Parcubacteria group bacterium GW2011_GWA2_40_143]KKR59014.1 MAG: Chromosome partition protein Smc [Parcubacteria group bacterium GW2011_GWC2_40_31]KKR81205.1 MAG: Chromosome partition protein Smc [Parcubacteria group bacterium GW2011_GWD2_40_9]HBB56494.1 hypothetical protein [Patescibacteria group bacterium]
MNTRLKRIELAGFKSFARPTVLQFPSPVTAIVGPNGSGKSNVAEALRWVLGEQSIRSLRGKKGEDLIFNGSGDLAKAGKASVALVFDNKDRKLPLDYDEVIITRKVYRNGENEYFLNDSQVRLRDIMETLSAVGLGASSHHIIGQGEADRILASSPKERKQIIEDALGLKIYQIKKNGAERKLAKTEENIIQIEALRKEVQSHLKFLKTHVEKAQSIAALKEELKIFYKQYLDKEKKYLESEGVRLAREREAPKSELGECEKRAKETESAQGGQASIIKKEIEDSEKEFADKERQVSAIRQERNGLERELGRVEGMIEYEESKNVGMRVLPAGEKLLPYAEVESVLKDIEKKVLAASEAADLADIKNILSEIAEKVREYLRKENAAELESEHKPNIADTNALKEKYKEMLSLIEGISNKEKEIYAGLSDVRRAIENKRAELNSLEKGKYQLEAKVRELRSILSQFAMEEEKIQIRRDDYERERAEAAAILGHDFMGELDMSQNSTTGSVWTYEEKEKILKKVERLKIKLEDYGSISDEVLKEYEDTKIRDEMYERELMDLKDAAVSLASIMKELDEKIGLSFKDGFEKINKELQLFFSSIFGGGKARLEVMKIERYESEELVAASDVIGESEGIEKDQAITDKGIELFVDLPKKKLRSLEMLSGGEKSLVSIALLFAISQVSPPPFLVLDETDAALDESNSQRYAGIMKILSEKTQLVIITHNRETMSQADILYGVTMDASGVSRLLSIKFEEAEKMGK